MNDAQNNLDMDGKKNQKFSWRLYFVGFNNKVGPDICMVFPKQKSGCSKVLNAPPFMPGRLL